METGALITAIVALSGTVAFLYKANVDLNKLVYRQQEEKLAMQVKHTADLKQLHKETLEDVAKLVPGGGHAV